MKSPSPIFCLILCALISLSTSVLTAQENPVSFYIAYQWPGSYCAAAKQGCCYPKSIRRHPSFTIGGIWPYTFSGDRPTYCKSKTPFSLSKISNLTKSLERNWPSLSCPSRTSSISSKKLWMQEWQKYGTCAESLFGGQYQYFHAGLNLRKKIDMLQILSNAGIHPNGSFYEMTAVFNAIQKATIYLPGFICNKDKSGNKQLYQIILCGNTAGTTITDCLGNPRSNTGQCPEKFKFPPLK
ncbi:extracellular ribonuclease LE-like [Rosa sericea]